MSVVDLASLFCLQCLGNDHRIELAHMSVGRLSEWSSLETETMETSLRSINFHIRLQAFMATKSDEIFPGDKSRQFGAEVRFIP